MPRFHRLGETRRTAESSGFFQWFSLVPVEPERSSVGRRTAHYRPGGTAFRSLAELVLLLDDADRLTGVELRLARAFIDDPRHTLFARDIAKSLLRDGLDGERAAPAADLANEVEFPRESTLPLLAGRTLDVALPDSPTSAYQVFLGRLSREELGLGSGTLVLENYERESVPWLRILLTASK